MTAWVVHRGGCHCGRVQFDVDAEADLCVDECNCSVCRAAGFWHLIVTRARFRLSKGHDELTSYRFNTNTAEHLFCRHCGIKSFYVPRSHPDGISVNARCLEQACVRSITIRGFDGAHWEDHVHELDMV